MDWIFLLLSCVCFVESVIRLGLLKRVDSIKGIAVKAASVIRSSRISDHWKEKILPGYSLKLLVHSLLLFATLVAAFSPFILFAILSHIWGGQFYLLVFSVKGAIATTIIAIAYAMLVSRRSRSTGNYGVGSRFLHQLVLGSPFFGEAAFDFEKILFASRTRDISSEKHVFVAGLARAGTTILMRKLYENGRFISLTYRDMPFVLAPNTWRQFSRFFPRKAELQERAHGDGLEIDFDSPEALEEVFWRVFCGPDYIKYDALVPMSADRKTVEKFRSYVALILKNNETKQYLSKNNNNILRLKSVATAFPDCVVLVPFREPVQQAFSLMNQHRRFMSKHAEDPFTRKYMTWLAHHEFGAEHRPFRFGASIEVGQDSAELSYWLKLWISTYLYIRENLPSQAILVSYESLCDDTEFVWGKLAEKIELVPYTPAISFSQSSHQVTEPLSADLVAQARELYSDLVTKSLGFKE